MPHWVLNADAAGGCCDAQADVELWLLGPRGAGDALDELKVVR